MQFFGQQPDPNTSIDVDPAAGKILVQFVDAEKLGSIFIPPTAQDRERSYGYVAKVGEDRTTVFGVVQKAPCKKGDVVIFSYDNLLHVVPETNKLFAMVDFDHVVGIDRRVAVSAEKASSAAERGEAGKAGRQKTGPKIIT